MAGAAKALVALSLLVTCSGLRVAGGRCDARLTRRSAVTGLAALGGLAPLAAIADTQAELSEPVAGFDTAADKRAAFKEKNKAYKKAWRRELSNLEFASNDAEAVDAINTLRKLIAENGFEIPEGVRKMDLDQVYRAQKDKLSKGARMEYAKLNETVTKIVTTKDMRDFEPF